MSKKKFKLEETPYTRTEVVSIEGETVGVNKTITLIENLQQLMKSRKFNFQSLSLDAIIPNPLNEYYRKITTEAEIKALASSIELQGLLHNLVVRTTDTEGVYMLLAGEKRYKALTLLKEQGINDYTDAIPVNLITANLTVEQEKLLIHASNIISRRYQKEALITAIDEFEQLLHILAEQNGEKVENINELIARLAEISVSKVKRYRSINKNLSPRLKKKFEDGEIGVRDAEEFIKLSAGEQEIAAEALDQGVKLNYGQTKAIVEEIQDKENEKISATNLPDDKYIQYTEIAKEQEIKQENEQESIDNERLNTEDEIKKDEERNIIKEKVKSIREEREDTSKTDISNILENSKKLFLHDLEKMTTGIKKSLDKYLQREEEYRLKYGEYSPEFIIISEYMTGKLNGGDK